MPKSKSNKSRKNKTPNKTTSKSHQQETKNKKSGTSLRVDDATQTEPLDELPPLETSISQIIVSTTTTTTENQKPFHGKFLSLLLNYKFIILIAVLAIIVAILRQPLEEISTQTKEKYVDPFVEKIALPNFAINLETGKRLREKGFRKKHPLVMIPGYITTSLELWEGLDCVKESRSRSQVWGGMNMMKKLLWDKNCWLKHMMLHPDTGLDPEEGIRIRAGEGIKSVDFFISGYFVFAPLVDNLSLIGYDVRNLYVATYDWRLSFSNMEHRDRYFTRLKWKIEGMRIIEGEKVVVVCHSLGAVLFYNFMQWIIHTQPNGHEWIDKHVEDYVDIAGPLLGLPKSAAAILSGEMRDTAQFGAFQKYLLNPFMSLEQRASLFRSWNSVLEMLMKGSSKLWNGDVILFDKEAYPEGSPAENVSVETMPEFLGNVTDDYVRTKLQKMDFSYRTDFENDPSYNASDPRYWSNPLSSQLPRAPNMKIHCLYGYGKETETGYYYRPAENSTSTVKYEMDVYQVNINESLSFGVFTGDGDGTVPLVSLGYPCAKLWHRKSHNPSGIKVVTREYKHDPLPIWEDVRGGAGSSDHVDILNNRNMISDVIYIASGNGDKLEDQISSEIENFPDLDE